MRDHFEPIYAHRFYVGSILCAYIELKSIFDHFEPIYQQKMHFSTNHGSAENKYGYIEILNPRGELC